MSIRYRRLLFVPLVLLAGLTLPRSAFAQPMGMGSARPGGGNQQLETAMSTLAYAQANLDRLKDHAMRALASDHTWSAAKAAVDDAQKAQKSAREQVRQRTMASAEYQALQHQVEATKSFDEKADIQAKMGTMLWDAEHQAPECQAADARLKQAQADLDARWKDYETRVLSRDPNWTAAVAARDAARAQVSAALDTQRSVGAGRQSGMGRNSGSYGRSSRGSSGSRGSRGRSY